ncbi:MAG: hypothetical protein ABI954_07740 [Pyrinomonadaceae bacterium]
MKEIILAALCLFAGGLVTLTWAQKKAAAYKLANIKIVPFEKTTGEFEAEIDAKDERAFFNEISKTYLVTVEVAGEAGSFELGRKVEIVVMEGKKIKARKLEQIDLIGGSGKVYMPLWIDAPLCDATTITARIIGQKSASTLKRTLTVFHCGE